MLQAYCTNVDLDANSVIPFSNVFIDKGCAEKLTAPATIELEQRGVYLAKVDGFATGVDAGIETIQLSVNGVTQPQAQTQFTVATGEVANFSFNTLIQVSSNNCSCNCYSKPTTLQVLVGDEALNDANVNIIITKLC